MTLPELFYFLCPFCSCIHWLSLSCNHQKCNTCNFFHSFLSFHWSATATVPWGVYVGVPLSLCTCHKAEDGVQLWTQTPKTKKTGGESWQHQSALSLFLEDTVRSEHESLPLMHLGTGTAPFTKATSPKTSRSLSHWATELQSPAAPERRST